MASKFIFLTSLHDLIPHVLVLVFLLLLVEDCLMAQTLFLVSAVELVFPFLVPVDIPLFPCFIHVVFLVHI